MNWRITASKNEATALLLSWYKSVSKQTKHRKVKPVREETKKIRAALLFVQITAYEPA